MKYINANSLLPDKLVKELQRYIQGGYIYIPDDENAWRKRPVKSRVCGLKDSMVRQEYDKINSLNGLK